MATILPLQLTLNVAAPAFMLELAGALSRITFIPNSKQKFRKLIESLTPSG